MTAREGDGLGHIEKGAEMSGLHSMPVARIGAALVLLLTVHLTPGVSESGPKNKAVCQGMAPSDLECEDSFLTDGRGLSIRIIFGNEDVPDYTGPYQYVITGPNARWETWCVWAAGITSECPVRDRVGTFGPGESVTLTTFTPGVGPYRISVRSWTTRKEP